MQRILALRPSRANVRGWAITGTMLSVGALFLLTLFAGPAAAQLPGFGAVETNMQTSFAPLIRIVRIVIMVICIIAAVYQGWKAAQGNSGGWINAVLLLLVAGFAAAPADWVNLFGLTTVATEMAAWGF